MKTLRSWLLIGVVVSLVGNRAAGEAGPSGLWMQLYAPDIKTYAANLRAAGAPPETITVIISHEVNARFRAREAALQPSTVTAKSLREDFSPDRREALVLLRVEKNNLLREALGTVPQEKVHFDWAPRVFERLSAAERDMVHAIMDDYDAMIARVNTEARGYLLDDDREKIRFLENERGRDLGNILSDAEVLDYELSETNFGRGSRHRLRLFEPTQEQLRTYLRLAKKNDMAFATRPSGSEELGNVRRAFEKDLAAAWDPETYACYRRTTSAHYIPVHNLVRRLKLDPDVAVKIYDSTRKTTEEGDRIFRKASPWTKQNRPRIAGFNSSVYIPVKVGTEEIQANAEAAEAIKALANEHIALARSLLGDAGYQAYFDFSRGWIEAMQNGRSVVLDFTMYSP